MPKTGRSAPRSRNGCWTCRTRKVKCDELRPVCNRCSQAGRDCEYKHAAERIVPNSSRSPAAFSPSIDPAVDNDDDGDDGDRIMRYYKENYLSVYQTKSPDWSFVSGVVYLGRTSSALMSIIMANVRYQASSVERRARDRYEALQHYQDGLRDFVSLVSSGQYDPVILLGTLFLLVQFELQHAEKAHNIRKHFEGFASAVQIHKNRLVPDLLLPPAWNSPPSASNTTSSPSVEPIDPTIVQQYRNVLNRLALWMNYMDAVASTWDLDGSVMDTFMQQYPGSLDTIFAGSRDAAQEIWGAAYPMAEALDDLQSRPAFDLFHEVHIIRHAVTSYRRAPHDDRRLQEIQSHIEKVTKTYTTLLRIAASWPNPSEPTTPRIILNLHFIVPIFYATQLDLVQSASSVGALVESVDTPHILSLILKIATIVHENEPTHAMCRLAWPLFTAGTETTDPVHQAWILDRFADLANFGISYVRAGKLLEAVVGEQRRSGGLNKVDYRAWIRDRDDFEPFII